jgi:hypothetical protein
MKKFASDRLTQLGLIIFGAVTAVYALTSLALPFGWDQGMMASVGNSYVHGKLPYVDSWDMKGPLAYVPYALVQLMFGPTMWGIRLFDIILSALTGWTFYKTAGALTNSQVGAWAAFALYYWIAAAGWFFTAAPDPWIGSLCVLAVMPLLAPNEPRRAWRFVLAGILIGCAGLIKPPYLLVGIGPLLSIILDTAVGGRQRVRFVLALAAGAIVPIVLVCAYFVVRGGLTQAIEVHILYPFSTYAALNVDTNALQGFATFFAQPTVALLAPFAALGAWSVRRQPRILWPTLSWLAATVLVVAMQGKYFFQHWLPVYAPLLLLSVLGAYRLLSLKEEAPRLAASAAALVFAVQVCALPLYGAAKCVYYLAVKRSPQRYYASFQFQNYNAADEQAAARYIRAHTRSTDGVFIWGNDATIRYLADRPNPTRFTFEMPLSLRGPYLDRYRAEAMHDLTARAPAYFVVGANWWAGDTKEQSLAKFPAMAAFLKHGYRLEKTFGVVDVYRRNGMGQPISS